MSGGVDSSAAAALLAGEGHEGIRVSMRVYDASHHARVERRGDRLALLAAADPAKDQSYFLYGLRQEALGEVLFPVGGLSKASVRQVAARAGLPNAHKPESQEICFVNGGHAADFV